MQFRSMSTLTLALLTGLVFASACGGESTPGTEADTFALDRAHASDEGGTEFPVRSLKLSDGEVLHGEVVEHLDDAVRFRFETEAGPTADATFTYDQLDSASVALMMLDRAGPDDARAHLEVGRYAADEGMFDVARANLLFAGQVEPELVDAVEDELGDLMQSAARSQLERGRDLTSQGDLHEAERVLGRLIREFPDTAAAADAQTELDRVQERLSERRDDEARTARLESVEDLVKQAEDKLREGLRVTRRSDAAIQAFLSARGHFQSAREEIAELRRSSDDHELLSALDDVEERLDRRALQTELHLAAVELADDDLQEARAAVERALRIDPDDREALRLRERILDRIDFDQEDDDFDGVAYERRLLERRRAIRRRLRGNLGGSSDVGWRRMNTRGVEWPGREGARPTAPIGR